MPICDSNIRTANTLPRKWLGTYFWYNVVLLIENIIEQKPTQKIQIDRIEKDWNIPNKPIKTPAIIYELSMIIRRLSGSFFNPVMREANNIPNDKNEVNKPY